nr:hypothetical protein [Tanacetum cinerariifolium]
MRRVGKGFSGVETPLFKGMLAVRQPAEAQVQVDDAVADNAVAASVEENVTEDGAEFPPHIQQVLDICFALTRRVENLENDKAAQKLEIIKLKARVKRLEMANKKRPQTESEARKNMMIYLKNTAGYKMDFFKGMSYAEICPIFQARFDGNMRFLFKLREEMEEEDQEIIKSINETPTQKAAKRRKLSEEAQEAEDLRKRLEVVDDEDDDVFIEATPLARKVPVVDYQIVLVDNKLRFKIIKAD